MVKLLLLASSLLVLRIFRAVEEVVELNRDSSIFVLVDGWCHSGPDSDVDKPVDFTTWSFL